MALTVGEIVWPNDARAAVSRYLEFLILVLGKLNIELANAAADPVRMTKDYLAGTVGDQRRDEAAIAWWRYLDERGVLRDCQDRDALMARVAICLLSVKEKDHPELGEHLSWFLEVLDFLDADVDQAIDLMGEHFNPPAQ